MMMISRKSNSGVLVIIFVALLLTCCSTNNNNSAAVFVMAASCNSDGVAIDNGQGRAPPCVDIGEETGTVSSSSYTGKAITTNEGFAVDAFLGIQYATHERFEKSKLKLTTPEDGDATVLGPSCPQRESVWSDASETDDSEDCLYLNIWRPDKDVNNALLPVMVWIHGGAYQFGSGNHPNFDGANLAGNENVIVITINYRLNVFGFMPFENDESRSGSGGGYTGGMNGILDQIRALEWVRNRIEDFGGNPDQVTIFGESAGAISVCQLSVIPEAKGLFIRSIMESGNCDFTHVNKTMLDEEIAKLSGCNDDDDDGTVCGIDELKQFSVKDLLNVTKNYQFQNVWDPAVVSIENLTDLYADSNNINPRDMIIGSNTKDDYNLVFYPKKNDYITNSAFENSTELAKASKQVKGQIFELYSDEKYGDSSVSAYAEFHGDFAFGCKSRIIATTAASSLKEKEKGGNVYFYSFGRLSPFDIAKANGLLQGPPKNIESDTSWASHEGEIPFVFGNPTKLPNLDPVIEEIPLEFDDAEKVLVKEIQSRWATFAKSGLATAIATATDYNVWSVVSNDSVPGSVDPGYMRFGDTGGFMVLSDENKNEQCTAMIDVYTSMGATELPTPAPTELPTPAPTELPTPAPTEEISIECGEFEVECDENIQALGVDCVLGLCIDCTPFLVNNGVDCLLNPFTFGRPDDSKLINELAFPNWCLKGGSGSDAEERISCNDSAKGEENGKINPKLFNPIYLTKKHSGAAPKKGGYPTNTDIQYVYEFAGPFLGQAGGGSSDQCPEDFDGQKNNYKQCGKLNTLDDDGPYGPGHVPPHIATAAIKFALAGEGNGRSAVDGPAVPDASWFDFATNGCRIKTSILFDCLRTFYPRTPGEVVKYPPPFTAEGGDYKLEFVNKVGDSCTSEKEKWPTAICFEEHSDGGPGDYPDYIQQGGGPHYCSKSAVEAEANDGWCPYLFFGPKRGQYRHPHIAYAALETYIAHQVLPDQCGTAWDDSRYPAAVDTTVAWPVETEVKVLTNNQADFAPNTLFSPNQPKTIRRRVGKSSKSQRGKLTFVWPDDNGFKKKPVIGQFANNIFVGAVVE